MCALSVYAFVNILVIVLVSTFETNLSSQKGLTLMIRVKWTPDIRMAQSNHSTRDQMYCTWWKDLQHSNLEALPENNLWSMLLVFLLTDPSRAEGGHAGQNCSSTPHQEVSVFGARHSNRWSSVCRNQAFNFSLEPLGKARQQGVPTYSQRGQKQSTIVRTLNRTEYITTLIEPGWYLIEQCFPGACAASPCLNMRSTYRHSRAFHIGHVQSAQV